MDWLQIIYSFIGSFFGFGFAIIAELIFSFLKSRKDMLRLFENLSDELDSIQKDLMDNLNKSCFICFVTPIWDSVIQSGDILKLHKVNKDLYDKVLVVYNKIAVLKIIEPAFSQNKDLVLKTRTLIVDEVKEIINDIGRQNRKQSGGKDK
jgi:hypothetical protein